MFGLRANSRAVLPPQCFTTELISTVPRNPRQACRGLSMVARRSGNPYTVFPLEYTGETPVPHLLSTLFNMEFEMGDYEPKKSDRFAFGLWTIQNTGRDPFGEPTRSEMTGLEVIRELGRRNVYSFEMHAEDLVPEG